MKFNKIDEVWNSANLLFKWIFRLLSSKLLLPWQRDVMTSPLYCKTNTQVRGIQKMPLLQNIQFYFEGKIPNNLCFQKKYIIGEKETSR